MHGCAMLLQDFGAFRRGRKSNFKKALQRWAVFVVLMVSVMSCGRACFSTNNGHNKAEVPGDVHSFATEN